MLTQAQHELLALLLLQCLICLLVQLRIHLSTLFQIQFLIRLPVPTSDVGGVAVNSDGVRGKNTKSQG